MNSSDLPLTRAMGVRPHAANRSGIGVPRIRRPETRPAPARPAPDREKRILDLRQFAHLGETEVVARRVAETRVDSVGPLFGLLDELDAASLQLLVGSLDIVGGEEDRAGKPFPHQGFDLL